MCVLCRVNIASGQSIGTTVADGGAQPTDAGQLVSQPSPIDPDASVASTEPMLLEGVSLGSSGPEGNASASNVATQGPNPPNRDGAANVDLNQPTARPTGFVNDALEAALTGTRLSRVGLRFSLNVFGVTGVGIGQNLIYEPPAAGGVQNTRLSFLATDLDLLIGARLSDNLQALGEILFETEPDNTVIFDVERLEIRYRSGRHFVGLGRTHVELGYWNTAFHHGYWLQPTISRPRAIRFEDQGGLIQAHSIGLVAGTGINVGSGGVNFLLGVANGRGDHPGNVQAISDNNFAKAISLKIESEGIGSSFLRFGVSGAIDWIAPADALTRPVLPDQEIFQAIGNVFLSYRGPNLTVLSEAYVLQHSAAGQSWRSVGGFAVLSYRFGIVSPYLAVDALVIPQNDPFFHPSATPTEVAPLSRVADGMLGTRFATGGWSALKLEYRPTYTLDTTQVLHSFSIQWGFGI